MILDFGFWIFEAGKGRREALIKWVWEDAEREAAATCLDAGRPEIASTILQVLTISR
jgi:hypothetical protein